MNLFTHVSYTHIQYIHIQVFVGFERAQYESQTNRAFVYFLAMQLKRTKKKGKGGFDAGYFRR